MEETLPEKTTYDTETKPQARSSLTSTDNIHTSLWSNVWYGIGMLTFILIPVLIPGMSVEVTVIGLFAIILGVYAVAGLFFIIRTRKSTGHRRRGRNR